MSVLLPWLGRHAPLLARRVISALRLACSASAVVKGRGGEQALGGDYQKKGKGKGGLLMGPATRAPAALG